MSLKKIPQPNFHTLCMGCVVKHIWKTHRPVCSGSGEITLGPKNHSYAAKLISSQVSLYLTVLLPIHRVFYAELLQLQLWRALMDTGTLGEKGKKKLCFCVVSWFWHTKAQWGGFDIACGTQENMKWKRGGGSTSPGVRLSWSRPWSSSGSKTTCFLTIVSSAGSDFFCLSSPEQFTIITLKAQCQIWTLLSSHTRGALVFLPQCWTNQPGVGRSGCIWLSTVWVWQLLCCHISAAQLQLRRNWRNERIFCSRVERQNKQGSRSSELQLQMYPHIKWPHLQRRCHFVRSGNSLSLWKSTAIFTHGLSNDLHLGYKVLPRYFVFVVNIVYAGPKFYKFRDICDFLAGTYHNMFYQCPRVDFNICEL